MFTIDKFDLKEMTEKVRKFIYEKAAVQFVLDSWLF